ncbi:arginase family protein [Solirubrobacter soli]|uniref:arginase family protein n=1 Tax=Solirubrobacter soli TaxID=363832 RepID=UPI0012FBF15A|nr:arginase family protein [Solirubrobacter soli]
MHLTAVDARISEDTPRDLRGVRELRTRLEAAYGTKALTIEGRQGPFERTHWRDDLAASEAVLREAAERVPGVILASDCSLALATLPRANATVLWLDAHADYDTPSTQTYDFLGCMSLAGATGAWESPFGAIDPRRVVHVGARSQPGDFDYAGQEQGRGELKAMLPATATLDEIAEALGPGPVYVHFDPDVLDPSINPIPYGRPNGMTEANVRAIADAITPVGLELCAFHSADDAGTRDRVAALLVDLVTAFLPPPEREEADAQG